MSKDRYPADMLPGDWRAEIVGRAGVFHAVIWRPDPDAPPARLRPPAPPQREECTHRHRDQPAALQCARRMARLKRRS